MPSSSGSSDCPKGWPSGSVTFIPKNIWSSDISNDVINYLTQRPKSSTEHNHFPNSHQSLPNGPCTKIKIKSIQDPNHPAHGQHGLFASQSLAPKSLILDYLGFIDLDANASSTSDYSMNFCRGLAGLPDIIIDAEKFGNEARFINDYRGIAQKPNAKFENYRDATGKVKVGVWVLGDKIKKGDEITVSYGKGFWHARASCDG